jgi:Ca-activated chloride channel family protein
VSIYLPTIGVDSGGQMASNRGIFLFLAVGLLVWPAGGSFAQSGPDVRIVTSVELVQIPVTIFDDKGSVATDLNKNDFLILEDGVEQRIVSCERERQSVSFVILADLSSSMTNKIPFVQEATLSILDPDQPRVPFHDEFSVFGVETRVTRLAPFTGDLEDLERRLPSLLTPTNGSTALFDGIYVGVTALKREAVNKRRAVVIISDGGDNHSRYSLRDIKGFLQEADVPVFAVMAGPSFELSDLFSAPQNKPKPSARPGENTKQQFPNLSIASSPHDYIGPAEQHGPHNLKALTEATGGSVFTARNLEDLPRIVRTLGLAVRYQYVLTYKPAPKPNAGVVAEGEAKWHKLHIELRPRDKFTGYGIPYYKRGYARVE